MSPHDPFRLLQSLIGELDHFVADHHEIVLLEVLQHAGIESPVAPILAVQIVVVLYQGLEVRMLPFPHMVEGFEVLVVLVVLLHLTAP